MKLYEYTYTGQTGKVMFVYLCDQQKETSIRTKHPDLIFTKEYDVPDYTKNLDRVWGVVKRSGYDTEQVRGEKPWAEVVSIHAEKKYAQKAGDKNPEISDWVKTWQHSVGGGACTSDYVCLEMFRVM